VTVFSGDNYFFLLLQGNNEMNERTFVGEAARLRDPARLALLEIERVVRISLEKLEIHSMLDIGTGTAIFAEAFFQKGLSVAGVDISDTMVAAAAQLLPKGDFRVGSMEKIPFKTGSFDLAFLGHVLHEADDATKALLEARRVACKRVVVFEWPYVEEKMGPPLAHRLRPDQVIDSAKKAGFKTVATIPMKHMALYVMDIS
jgi:ubiquinone/menaquinone biosynthesis C-methylase UbiE